MTKRLVGALIVLVLGGAARPVSAQTPASVRVVAGATQIMSRPSADAEVVISASAGTVLEVVDGDGQWLWVSLPPDSRGSRSRGWVHASDVQVVSGDRSPQQPAPARQPASPQASIIIPPSAEDIRAEKERRDAEALRVEKLKREMERRQGEYEAVRQSHGLAPSSDAPPLPSRHGSFTPERPKYEFFGGYSLLWDTSDSISFPLGWIVSVSRQMNGSMALMKESMSIVGEASGSYRSASILGVLVASQNIHTFTAGPRFSGHFRNLRTYGQLLGGLEISNGSLFGYSNASSTGFALTPGFGVDLPIAQSLGVRLGGEFGFLRNPGGWYNGFRITTGLVVLSKQ